MASWYDDLLKRQEYQAIQGQPTYKPNAFQEMFTPKGMEYQWQNRPDQGGGEFTGEIEGVYEGDAQDLRMVKPGLSIATPTVPDGTQSNPGGLLPVTPSVDGYSDIPVAGFAAPKSILAGTRNLNPRVWPQHSPIRNPSAVPSSGQVRPPTGPTSGPYNTRPINMGADAGARFNPALSTQQSHASLGRGATVQAGGVNVPVDDALRNEPHRNLRRYTGTHPLNTGSEPLNAAESESQRWQREVEARRAGRAGAIPVVEPKVGASVSGGAPGSVSKFWGEGFMKRSVPGWLGAKGAELVGEGSKWWRGLGEGRKWGGRLLKGAGATLSGLSRGASAAMYANLMAEIMGTEDLPDWYRGGTQEMLGRKPGLLNRDLSPDERLAENTRLSELASIAEYKGNAELANEIRSQIQHDNLTGLGFALDPRAWAESDVWNNMTSYYGNMFTPDREDRSRDAIPNGLENAITEEDIRILRGY
jgi:hypothetical protein